MTLSKEDQKLYAQQHYQDNKAKYQANTKAKKSLIRKIVIELKHNMPCMDCDIAYPYWVLQYDHRPGVDKKFNIADTHMISSVSALLAEIDKCDLVCANCHATRTYERSSI